MTELSPDPDQDQTRLHLPGQTRFKDQEGLNQGQAWSKIKLNRTVTRFESNQDI